MTGDTTKIPDCPQSLRSAVEGHNIRSSDKADRGGSRALCALALASVPDERGSAQTWQ